MVKKIFISLLVFATGASAQLVTGRATTSAYSFQAVDTEYTKQTYFRTYENIYLNIAQDNVSVNVNALASKDFGSTIVTDPELRVSSLMVKVRNIGGLADLSAGRQFVFAGAGYGLIDGVVGKIKLFDDMMNVVGYGGTNVTYTRELKKQWIGDNGLYGGQVILAPVENGSVGLSYMKKNMVRPSYTRLDSLFNPYTIDSRPLAEELAAVDVDYDFTNVALIEAKSEYNVLEKKLSRIQAFTRVTISDELGATAEFISREARVYYNSIFSVFDASSTQEIEGGLEYRPMAKTFVFARFGNVQYSDTSSQRLVVGGTYDFLSATYTQNFGYAGDLNGISLQAVYPLKETMFTPTVGVGYASYQLSKDAPKNSVFNALAGVSIRPAKQFSTDLQFQWMNNPMYSSDMRVFLKATYWFNDRLGWF